MHATAEPESADEVYRVLLEPTRRGRLPRMLRGALDLWCAMSGGLLELSHGGELVVREHLDGREVARVPAPTPRLAAELYDEITDQLATLSPAEFRAVWHVAT
ncbi:MAG: hypothetical protein F2667_03620 [Actinobacteria bacterium]|uniref:Unannotated protein n=1 Tax=freshwater metagenome TaxID=449393 RepID=A0A6J6PBK6_9ZZZZ|nr:hypothetical protein [Actinomycetota bacterium]